MGLAGRCDRSVLLVTAIDPDAPCQQGGEHAWWELHRFSWPWHQRIWGMVIRCLWCGHRASRSEARSSIGVADLAACIQASWLVLEEEPPEKGDRPERFVQLPLLTIEEAQLLLGGLRSDEAMSESRPGVRSILNSLRTALREAISSAQRQGGTE